MAQSIEEKRAKAAERALLYRERKRRERDAKAAAEAAAAPPETAMQDDVEAAIASMSKWLAPSDVAALRQARMIAKMIDKLTHEGDVVKALNAHGRLTRVLTELGGTPTVRMAHELRSLKATAKAGADDERKSGEGAEGAAGESGVVSRFERPAKRAG